MTDRGHETLEHAADMGVRGWGPEPESAFEETALGVLDLMAERKGLEGEEGFSVTARGDDLPGLLVELLNEMISLSDLEEAIFTDVSVSDLGRSDDGWSVRASFRHVPREGQGERVLADVKAVAWYGAEVSERPDSGWTAQCLVDL